MNKPLDSDISRHEYAVERSHKDAEASNATARATAQAMILINGGAATAILAFLAKDTLDPLILRTASVCLVGYVIGVLAGAFMMYCSARALDFYSFRWRLTAHPGDEEGIEAEYAKRRAGRWWRGMRNWFYCSVSFFLIPSSALAWALYRSVE